MVDHLHIDKQRDEQAVLWNIPSSILRELFLNWSKPKRRFLLGLFWTERRDIGSVRIKGESRALL